MQDPMRAEYPAMLTGLQPSQAVQTINDRVKRMARVSAEIADWLQERRRIEDLYVQGMRKLLAYKVPNSQSELGIFQPVWDKILASINSTATAHHVFAERLERDVETPLRQFPGRREMHNVQTISANLAAMARELDDAQDKSDRLQRKATRANPQKLEAATSRLDAASQNWEAQAPYIFENLQALDEMRVDQLRDLLTQMLTHEADVAQRRSDVVAGVLAGLLDVQTADEIQAFAAKSAGGKPRVDRRATGSGRTQSAGASAGGGSGSASASLTVPSPGANSGGGADDDASDQASMNNEPRNESRLRRLGTMLGRRRQSIHGGFGQLSGFSRNIGSSHGRSLSPRTSSNNLSDPHRLSSLAETPDSPTEPNFQQLSASALAAQNEGPNGFGAGAAAAAEGRQSADPGPSASPFPPRTASTGIHANGAAEMSIFDIRPDPSRQTAAAAPSEPAKDAEGFTIPPPATDPISQAQREASGLDEPDHQFKVSIQNTPVADEDPDAKQAAMSNVATTLSQMAMPLPSRKLGTVRGRRDVRNTIYVPATLDSDAANNNNPFAFPLLPPLPLPFPSSLSAKSPPLAVLASEASVTGTSDTQSVRSGNSLGSTMAHWRHPDLAGPGLHASIIEMVSASFEDGQVKSVGVTGEIAFSYGTTAGSRQSNHSETIRINNFPSLGSIGPNRIFVHNSPAGSDQFTLDTAHLVRGTSTAFSYRVFSDAPTTPADPATPSAASSSLAKNVPLVLRPAWKPDGDKLGLLLHYSPNPGFRPGGGPVVLRNVIFMATYVGGRAPRAQTKPSGTHLGDKGLVYWRLGDLTIDPSTNAGEGRIACRIIGPEGGPELRPSHVEARWEYTPAVAAEGGVCEAVASGISISRRAAEAKDGEKATDPVPHPDDDDDPFADTSPPYSPYSSSTFESGKWVEVPLVRMLVSGKYESLAPGSTAAAVPSTPSTTAATTGVLGSPSGIPASA